MVDACPWKWTETKFQTILTTQQGIFKKENVQKSKRFQGLHPGILLRGFPVPSKTSQMKYSFSWDEALDAKTFTFHFQKVVLTFSGKLSFTGNWKLKLCPLEQCKKLVSVAKGVVLVSLLLTLIIFHTLV